VEAEKFSAKKYKNNLAEALPTLCEALHNVGYEK
jgi:hypothetical protein